jgi:hypothetical protein
MTVLTGHRMRSQPGRRVWRLTLPVAVALTWSGTGAAGATAPAASGRANLLTSGDLADGRGAGWTCPPGARAVPGYPYLATGT